MIETLIRCEIHDPFPGDECAICGEWIRGRELEVEATPPILLCIPCAEGLARCIVASVVGEGPDG